MALLSTFSQKEQFVKTIFDNFAHDVFFKDLVFLVGDEQLAYHSQILRNIFPFLKNFLPNPGTYCACEAFLPSRSSVFITLDGVSPSTVSILMSSIYNQHKPTFHSVEELERVKELLAMLGAESQKYNICLNASAGNNAVQTDVMDIVIVDDSKSNEFVTSVNINKSSVEMLLNENLTVRCSEALDTVNEAVVEEWQGGGSFSSTVPEKDDSSDLDESVEDEEITFSFDATNQEGEMDEDHDAVSSPKGQEQVQSHTGVVGVLNMVEEFMNDDVNDAYVSYKINIGGVVKAVNINNEVINANHSEDAIENLEADGDIEVIAEVVDGVTEVVKEIDGSQSPTEILQNGEVETTEIIKDEIALNSKESVDLEIVIEDQTDDMQESTEMSKREEQVVNRSEVNIGNRENDDTIENELMDETSDNQQIDNLVGDSDKVNDSIQEALNEVESHESKPTNLDEVIMDSEEDMGASELANESSNSKLHQQSVLNKEDVEEHIDDDLIEDEEEDETDATRDTEDIPFHEEEHSDDDLIEDEEEDKTDATRVSEDIPFQDKLANQEVIDTEEQRSARKASTGFSNMKRKFSEESDIKVDDGAKSDESDNEDFDLESLSAPLDEVKRVKRDLSESFEMDKEEESNQTNLGLVGTEGVLSSVSVSFKGDDLDMMTDIPALKKRQLSEEDMELSNEVYVKKVKVDESSEDDVSVSEESSEDEELPENDIEERNYECEDLSVTTILKDETESLNKDELASDIDEDNEVLSINHVSVKRNRIVDSSDEDDDPTGEKEKIEEKYGTGNDEKNYEKEIDGSSGSEEFEGEGVEECAKESPFQQEMKERHSDNEEDSDLFNIDEDDVDMLNEQTEPLNSDVQQGGGNVIEADARKENAGDEVEKEAMDLKDVSNEDSVEDNGHVSYHEEAVYTTDVTANSLKHDKTDKLYNGSKSGDMEGVKAANVPDQVATDDGKVPADPVGLCCTLCPNQPAYKRGQLLMHLTDKHYYKDLLQLYPFTEGSSCQFCVDNSRAKVTISKTKATYVKHVGTVHEKVLDLVPLELREAVLAVNKRRTSVSIREVETDGLEFLGAQKQELAGGFEVNTIKEETIDPDTIEADAIEDKEVSDTSTENAIETVVEVKFLSSGRCPFCPNTKTQFQRSSLLNHLSSTHYNKQLLDAFPYQEGETCKLCVDTGRPNPLIARSKPRYINHMGSLHEKVLDLLPVNLRDDLEGSKKVPARTTRRSVISKDSQENTPSSLPPVTIHPVAGPSSSRGPAPGPSTRAPAPGPPGPPSGVASSKSLPKSWTVSTVPEKRLASMGNVSISKVQEKNISLPKLANVSISKIE